MSIRISTSIAFALLFSGAACADDGIATDRPDFVESSATVGKGWAQVETSVAYEKDTRRGSTSYTASTPTLLRYGISENLELRLESDGYTHARISEAGETDRARGWSDLSLGIKWHLHDGAGIKPSTALLLHADIDSGSSEFRGEGVRPSLRAVAEWELPNDWSLGVMPGIVGDKDENGRYTAGLLGVVVGKGITEQLRVFGELEVSQIASSEHGGTVASWTAGTAYLLGKYMQLDAALSVAANHRAPDAAATVGFSFKF